MKKFIIPILAGFGLLLSFQSSAQLQLNRSLNPFWFQAPEIENPSLAALNPVPSIAGFYSSSLNGFDNHPVRTAAIGSAFLSDRVGTALKLSNEKMGLSSSFEAQFSFLCKFYLGKKDENRGHKMIFSLSGAYIEDHINRDEIKSLDPNDPLFSDLAQSQPQGSASTALAFIKENHYYFGFSVENLFRTKGGFRNDSLFGAHSLHYSLQASKSFSIARKVYLELYGTGKMIDPIRHEWAAGTRWKFNQTVVLNLGYQSNQSILFGLSITAQSFTFGYLGEYNNFVDASKYTYKTFGNFLFIRKIFAESHSSR